MTKKKSAAEKEPGMVVHLSPKTHSKLKLHTLLKKTRIGGKITLATEAEKAIENYISKEGYV